MNEFELAEKVALDRHEPSWRAQGYRVVRHPSRETLPAFLDQYKPDAILVGRKPQVWVEVVRKGQPQVEHKIRGLNALLKGHDDWRLEVLYAGEEVEQLPAVPTRNLRSSLTDIRRLIADDRQGSLLRIWATLEALARRLEPTRTLLPQSPGRVVELLAGAGFVAPSQAEHLREAVQWRNRLVHGDLNVSPSERQLLSLIDILNELIAVVEARDIASQG
jgi:hypothetical protein